MKEVKMDGKWNKSYSTVWKPSSRETKTLFISTARYSVEINAIT